MEELSISQLDFSASVPRLLYRSNRAAIYVGDCAQGLEEVFATWRPAVVLTDPAYAFWSYIKETTNGDRPYDRMRDLEWMANVSCWLELWLPPLRRHLTGEATVAWFFQNPHYAALTLRWATWLEWPLSLLAMCTSNCCGQCAHVGGHPEMLLRFADKVAPLPAAQTDYIREAIGLNRYGGRKSVEMLSLLLEASPPGAVLDPFCGTGSTLEAALSSGRQAVGFEIEEDIAASAVLRLIQVERQLDRASISLTG